MKPRDHSIMESSSGKLENCEVCAVAKAKYTCPKCEVRTCTLTCVNIHKKELQCDGIRDKTKFVPLHEFTDLDLLSDYRLLEEVGRSVDKLQRDPLRKCTRFKNLPPQLQKMRSAAYRSGVQLQFMPQNFSRHKENTTFYNWKTNKLFWRIEWIFPQAENTKWVTQRAEESTRLSDIVQNVWDPSKSIAIVSDPFSSSKDENFDDEDENTRKILHERLQYYRSTELTGIKLLLKAEKVKNSDSRFHELDPTLSLKENLEKKTIIEFPTIYVVMKDHADAYEIIDSDEEEEKEARDIREHRHRSRGGDQTRRRGKPPIKKEKKSDKESSINYFFDGEFTDSEDDCAVQKNFQKAQKSSANGIPRYDELVRMQFD